MGNFRSGRHRKPSSLLKLQGGRLRSREDEPQYPAGEPDIPPRLAADERAQAAWHALARGLTASRVLTRAHGEALAMLAESLADLERAREQLAAMKFQQFIVDEFVGSDGRARRKIRINPLLRESQRLALLASRLLGEFGLTPITAPKVAAQRLATAADSFDALLASKPGY